MKKLLSLVLLSALISPAFADNLYQSSNPFPQTAPQSLNNIYESEPAVIQKEEKQKKKSWFKKGKNLQEQDSQLLNTYPPANNGRDGANEGIQNGSFYIFK